MRGLLIVLVLVSGADWGWCQEVSLAGRWSAKLVSAFGLPSVVTVTLDEYDQGRFLAISGGTEYESPARVERIPDRFISIRGGGVFTVPSGRTAQWGFVIEGHYAADGSHIVGTLRETVRQGTPSVPIELVRSSTAPRARSTVSQPLTPQARATQANAATPTAGKTWIVTALRTSDYGSVRVDETEVSHVRKDCPALKGRKIDKYSAKFRREHNSKVAFICQDCRRTATDIASGDVWRISSTFDKSYAKKVHAYNEAHPEETLALLKQNPGYAELVLHYDLSCPIADRRRIWKRIKFQEYASGDGYALSRLCPICQQRRPGVTPSHLHEIDSLAEYRAERGIPEPDRGAQIAALIGAIGNAAAAASGGQPVAMPPSGMSPRRSAVGETSSERNRQCRHELRGASMLTQQSAVAPSAGGTIQVRVEIPAGCQWRFDPKVPVQTFGGWLTTTSPLSGIGPAAITFMVDPFAPTQGPDSRGAPFDFQNLSSPDFNQCFRVAQCSPDIPIRSCSSGFTCAQ